MVAMYWWSFIVLAVLMPCMLCMQRVLLQNTYALPVCDNVLQNLTNGYWAARTTSPNFRSANNDYAEHSSTLREERERLNRVMRKFWARKGIPQDAYSSTEMCGYYRYKRANSTSHKVGTWCDPNSATPCCSNRYWGVCSPPSVYNCKCPSCVDTRLYDHAALREWKPRDSRCQWQHYSRDDACDVIESSPYKDIYFVGDSFTRIMFSSLLMRLTNRPVTGAWRKNMTDQLKDLCSDSAFPCWKACRQLTSSFDDMEYRSDLCAGRNVTFRAFLKRYYNTRYSLAFKKLVQSNLGRAGSIIIVSMGFHEQFNFNAVAWRFMEPAVRLITEYYRMRPTAAKRWPQIMYSLPMRSSLLKPTDFVRFQPEVGLLLFETQMRIYCRQRNIEVLDFQNLGENVYSYDGVHYDLTVNDMKNQVLLNYFASVGK
ncbi:uncharacterized protein LOC100176800 [Ciona intestinalis]